MGVAEVRAAGGLTRAMGKNGTSSTCRFDLQEVQNGVEIEENQPPKQ